MITRTATVASKVGLHARPASLVAQKAEELQIEATLVFDGEEADVESTLEIMSLGVKLGDVVTLNCEDDSAGAKLDELAAYLEQDLDAE